MRVLPLLLILLLPACGGEVDPTPSCVAYVRCLAARDVSMDLQTDVERFEAGGACWGSGEAADFCDGACARGLAWLREAESDTLPDACAP